MKLNIDFLSEACCNYQHLFGVLCYIITVKDVSKNSKIDSWCFTARSTDKLKSLLFGNVFARI